MKITATTTLAEFAPFVGLMVGGESARLATAAERHYLGSDGWWAVEIGTFCEMCRGDFSHYGITRDKNITVLGYYFIQAFSGFVDEFLRLSKNLTPPATIAQSRAESACMPLAIDEGLLIFTRNYFGLPSFDEAAHRTLAEWLLAKRDTYNMIVSQRAFASSMAAPSK